MPGPRDQSNLNSGLDHSLLKQIALGGALSPAAIPLPFNANGESAGWAVSWGAASPGAGLRQRERIGTRSASGMCRPQARCAPFGVDNDDGMDDDSDAQPGYVLDPGGVHAGALPESHATQGQEQEDGGPKSGVVTSLSDGGDDVDGPVHDNEPVGDQTPPGTHENSQVERQRSDTPDPGNVDPENRCRGQPFEAAENMLVHEPPKAIAGVLFHLMQHVDRGMEVNEGEEPAPVQARQQKQQKDGDPERCRNPAVIEPGNHKENCGPIVARSTLQCVGWRCAAA